MLANYFAAAVRNLLRNRAYAIINLLGLSLGFAAAILIALYVKDEYSYDAFVPDRDRIYQVNELIQPPGRAPIRLSVSSATDAPALQLAFPEIELATRLGPANVQLRRTGTEMPAKVKAAWAEPGFFQMFPLRAVSGNLSGALSRPDEVVLTRKAARQLFGAENPVGKTLSVDRANVLRVTAVVEDLPSNSHFNVEVFLPGIASFSSITAAEASQRGGAARSENLYTYVRLRSGASIDAVTARLRSFVDTHVPGMVNNVPISKAYTFILTPLADLHLAPASLAAMKPPSDPRVVYAFTGVALLILVVACGNFVSMMTARATRRAVEVGVRKAVGASRRQIMVQFLGECLFYAALALIPALIAVKLILPAFNGFLQRQIAFDLVGDPVLALGVVALTLLTGIAAGAYPALYLSRFRPNVVLKGTTTSVTNSGRVRQGLVVFQFATLIALLVATATVYRQTQYAIEGRLSVSADQIWMGDRSVRCTRNLIGSVRAVEGVRAATCASASTLTFGNITAIFMPPGNGAAVAARAAPIEPGFFDLFGIKPVAGRLPSTQHGSDDALRERNDLALNPTVVINESAARALGFTTPAAAVGKFRPWKRIGLVEGQLRPTETASSEIVGVVPDFSIGSVREAIEPTAYYLDPTFATHLVLELKGGAIRKGLDGVEKLWARQQPGTRLDGTFLSQYMNDLYADIRTQSTMFSAFAGIAVALASLGLLGLAIFAAERRTKEIGLRKVMGARRGQILLFLTWQFSRPVLWANLIAWPVAYFVMRRWLEGFAYHVDLGVLTFLLAGALALAIALASVSGHALLVARARPVTALRHE